MSDSAQFQIAMRKYKVEQHQALVDAFDEPLNYPIAVKDPYEVLNAPGIAAGAIRIDWNRYGEDFIRRVAGHIPEYWVRVGSANNRCRDGFVGFLGSVMNTEPVYGQLRDAGLNVDHMYAQSVAQKEGLRFVRTALISSTVNQDTGWAIEKGLKRESAISPERRNIDIVAIMKGMNIRPPLNMQDYELRRNYIADALNRAGIRDKRESILMMMDGFLQYYPVLGGKANS